MKENNKSTVRLVAMTLVEVLVALAIISFVFSSLTQMTFDGLKRTKKLELQDKMRNYATEAVQIIYNAKNVNWQGSGGFTKMLPPVTAGITPQVYVNYDDFEGTRLLELSPADCSYDAKRKVIVGADCAKVIPPETLERNMIFGRVIQRLDNDIIDTGEEPLSDTVNDAEISIIVACIDDMCDPSEFAPFILNFKVFRTGAAQ